MDQEIYRIVLALVLSGLVFFAWQYYQGTVKEKPLGNVAVSQQVEKTETQEKIIRKDLSNFKNCGYLKIVVYPIYKSLEYLYRVIKNLGGALILLTLIIRILLAPLMIKQVNASKKMASLQSKIKEIKKRYGDNPMEMQKAVGKLYKENGVNPFGSVGLLILQIPLFYALYKIVREASIFSGAPLGFWVQDLGVADPYFILPLIAGLVMFLGTMFLSETNTQMPKLLTYIFPVLCAAFLLNQPAGLALYFLVGSVCQLGMNIAMKVSMHDRGTIISK